MEKLRNGALKVDERRTIRGETIVLAYREGGHCPWITWRMDGEGNTFWGCYFQTLAEAVKSLERRAGENLV